MPLGLGTQFLDLQHCHFVQFLLCLSRPTRSTITVKPVATGLTVDYSIDVGNSGAWFFIATAPA